MSRMRMLLGMLSSFMYGGGGVFRYHIKGPALPVEL